MLPQEFLERMENMLGEEYPAFLKSYDIARYQALRLNPQKGDDASFLNRMVFSLERVPWAEHGYYYTAQDTPGKHPYHEAGVYYIQEPSAMAPAAYLTRQMADGAGERILDLCAAPGGKSTQIAAAMAGKGILISNEIHPARAKILSENIERMGIANAVVTNETPQRLAEHFSEYFTRIMVDAPCSGEGMFRKNEEACEQWSTQNVELCADRQDEMSFIEVRTNPGMITTIVLPDSSRVWLNSESYLKYPVRFAKNERNVILQGEGYFSVRKNVDSRFTVQTPHHTQIQVLGTEFNVEAYEKEDEVNTTLVSGKVQFQYDSERGKKRMDLLPGEKITYNSISGEVFVSRAAVLSDISWKEGKIIL